MPVAVYMLHPLIHRAWGLCRNLCLIDFLKENPSASKDEFDTHLSRLDGAARKVCIPYSQRPCLIALTENSLASRRPQQASHQGTQTVQPSGHGWRRRRVVDGLRWGRRIWGKDTSAREPDGERWAGCGTIHSCRVR